MARCFSLKVRRFLWRLQIRSNALALEVLAAMGAAKLLPIATASN
jgi:hypothetical protein